MSSNNGTPFRRLSHFSPSNHPTTSALSNNDGLAQQADLNSIIPSRDSLSRSFASSIKRPFTSVKQLDITQISNCDQDLHTNHVNKRIRTNNDGSPISGSPTWIDSLRRTNEPLSLQQRSSSRLSISTASSTSTTPALYKNPKFLISSQRLSTPDRLFQAKNAKGLNLSTSDLYGQSKSRFFDGKTLFGSANLNKNLRRLSTTPYALNNIRTIEAKPSRQSVAFSALNSDSQLSSVTQKVLESLEKATTPIQDAKRRFTTSYQSTTTPERPYIIPTAATSKLFDSSTPSVTNNGRCNVDFSYKPLKYILTPSVTNDSGLESKSSAATALLDKELDKLREIKRAEKALENEKQTSDTNVYQPRKDQTFGKITKRDVEKGRKLNDTAFSDNAHLDALANLKPLSVPVSTLKPFTFSEKQPTQPDNCTLNDKFPVNNKQQNANSSFNFSSPTSIGSPSTFNADSSFKFSSVEPIKDIADISVKPLKESGTWDEQFKPKGKDWDLSLPNDTTKDNVNDVDGACLSKRTDSFVPPTETTISLSDKFKQKKQSNTWSCPTCCVDNESSDDKCVACEEPNPNKKKSEDLSVSAAAGKQPDFKFGNFSTPITTSTSSNSSSLNELFKKKTSSWTCPTCMVSNDADELKCISCEEPNPNKKTETSSAISEKPVLGFKFGNFSSPINSTAQSGETLKAQTDNKPCSTVDSWTCYYCKGSNAKDAQKCSECLKVKTLAATKDEVHKFYDSQTFKFGFNNPTLVASSKTNSDTLISTEIFKFEAPTLASPIIPSRQSESCDANTISSSKPTEEPVVVVPIAIPFSKQDINKSTLSDSPFKSAPKVESEGFKLNNNENKKVSEPLATFNSIGEDKQPPKSAFKFVSAATNDVSTSLFKFGASDPLKSIGTKSAATTAETTTASNSLFTFGSKSTVATTEAPSFSFVAPSFSAPKLASTTESSFKSPSPPTTTVPKISFGTENVQPAPSTLPTTTTSASSNLFDFAPKTTSSSISEPAKPMFNFSSIPASSLGSASVTAAKTSATGNLFQFGSAAATTAPAKTETGLFSFAPVSTTLSTTTTSSASFSFAPPALSTTSIASTTTTTAASSIASKFSFGAPVSIPKIDVGSPVPINPKLSINFSQQSVPTTSNSAAPSLFSFGSQNVAPATNSIIPAFGATQPPEKPDYKFNFAPTSLNKEPANVFAPISVPTFNFSANSSTATSTASNSSLFAFGAKPSEPPSTGFAFQAPQPAAATGFNFSAPSQNAVPAVPSFNATFNATQSQLPSFGGAFTPINNVTAPQTNAPAFDFNPKPSLNFGALPPNPANDANNMFAFNADPNAMGANRQIKKAKRRLR